MSRMPVTLIIPFYNEEAGIETYLTQIKPIMDKVEETLFIDSGSTDQSQNKIREQLPERDHYQILKVPMEGEKSKISLPGRSRNYGIKESGTPWVAFLDMGIDVRESWFDAMWELVQRHPESGALGKCFFTGYNSLSRALCALSNGLNQTQTTLPGSIIPRSIFTEIGFFPEHLRSAEDLVWRNKYTEKYGEVTPEDPQIGYNSYPSNIFAILRKYFIYAKNTVWAGVSLKQVFLYIIYFSTLFLLIPVNLTILVSIIALHYIGRGIVDPIRRSRKGLWFGKDFFAAILAFQLAFPIDVAKVLGFLWGFVTFRKS